MLIVGDAKDEVVFAALGALRCECAKQLGILDPRDFKFLWVTEFPMFEFSEEENRYVAMHHPFTAPMDEDLDKLETDKKNCRAKAYDIVLNGTELGGGSIRISVPETQEAMFRAWASPTRTPGALRPPDQRLQVRRASPRRSGLWPGPAVYAHGRR